MATLIAETTAVTDTQMTTAMAVIVSPTPVTAETVHTADSTPKRGPRVGADQLPCGEVCPSCEKDTEYPGHGRARVMGRGRSTARICPNRGPFVTNSARMRLGMQKEHSPDQSCWWQTYIREESWDGNVAG
jgi:hypothetical protein